MSLAAWIARLRARIEAFITADGNPEISGVLGKSIRAGTAAGGRPSGRYLNTTIHGLDRAVLADKAHSGNADRGNAVLWMVG